MAEILEVSIIGLWVLGIFNLLLTLSLARSIANPNPIKETLKVGRSAPDFEATTLEGSNISLAHFAGRRVGFVFVSASCQPCIDLVPALEAAKQGASRNGLDLVIVSSSDADATKEFVSAHEISLKVIVAPKRESSFFKDYKAAATPFYCILDDEGKVQESGLVGEVWKNTLAEWTMEEKADHPEPLPLPS